MSTPVAKEKPHLPFRVHFVDGRKCDVKATDAADARKKAGEQHSGRIDKVKLVREG